MASVVITMTSLGAKTERCAGCARPIPRGQLMSAVKDAAGDSVGWFCPICLSAWKTSGMMPVPGRGELND